MAAWASQWQRNQPTVILTVWKVWIYTTFLSNCESPVRPFYGIKEKIGQVADRVIAKSSWKGEDYCFSHFIIVTYKLWLILPEVTPEIRLKWFVLIPLAVTMCQLDFNHFLRVKAKRSSRHPPRNPSDFGTSFTAAENNDGNFRKHKIFCETEIVQVKMYHSFHPKTDQNVYFGRW